MLLLFFPTEEHVISYDLIFSVFVVYYQHQMG